MSAAFKIVQTVEAATRWPSPTRQHAVDASVAPGWVLASHPQHQGPDRLWGGRATWLSSRVGPAAGDEVGMPAQ